jgi:FxsC-like protein
VSDIGGTSKIPRSPGHYFFLSYAHSAPLSDSTGADPDQWVSRFFHHLSDAVKDIASPSAQQDPGFFDQEIPLGSDWRASLTRALSVAQVFVPLYSPSYFAQSLPGREWACFYDRTSSSDPGNPQGRFAPVLWIPVPRELDQPGVRDVFAIADADQAYADNGMRALLRLRPYNALYQRKLGDLAAKIVELAEHAPIQPSEVEDIDAVTNKFNPEASAAVFAVAVAAPALKTLPDGADRTSYRDSSDAWRPFPREQKLSLAEYAGRVAERLDFAVRISSIEKTTQKTEDALSSRPGVILIDPWFIADKERMGTLRSFVRDMPSWVLPLLVIGSPQDTRTAQLAKDTKTILTQARLAHTETARRAVKGVTSLQDFVNIMPMLVVEAERQYLRHGPVKRSKSRPGAPPLLAGDRGLADIA